MSTEENRVVHAAAELEQLQGPDGAVTTGASSAAPLVIRRELFSVLVGGLGAAALLGCSTSADAESSEELAAVEQPLGTDVNTISGLRGLAAPTGGNPSRLILGYATPGDGGGGVFVWTVFTATAPADDDGTIIKPSGYSGLGRWLRIYEGDLNVRWFGATGNGTTADDAAINRAVSAIVTSGRGGTLMFPPGTYRCNASINLDQCGYITLQGVNGARLSYAGATGSLILARSSRAIKIRDLVLAAAGAFNGNLVDFGHAPVASPADTGYASVERCEFASPEFPSPVLGTTYAHSYIRLSGTICSRVVDSSFTFGETAIIGLDATYSNAIDIEHCTFMQQTVAAIKNAGESWRISNCTFEPTKSGAAGAYRSDPGVLCYGIAFHACWFGDAGTGDWIDIAGYGIDISGCFFYGNNGAAIIIRGGEGVAITGNGFWCGYGVRFLTGGVYVMGVHVAGNTFQTQNPIDNMGFGLGTFTGNYGLGNRFSYGLQIGVSEAIPAEWSTNIGYMTSLPVNKILTAIGFLDGATGYPHCSLGLMPSSSTATNAEVVVFGRDGAGVLKDMARFGPAGIGFFGHAPAQKPVVSGSRSGNAALASLVSALSALGLVTDNTTA